MKHSNKSKYLFFGILVIGLVAIGYFREYIFVSINYQLYRLHYNVGQDYPLPDKLKFLDAFGYWQLYYIKWFLTVLFSLIYFFIALNVLFQLFGKTRAVITITTGLHLLIVVISGICYSYDFVFENTNYKGYELSRVFMGFLQSPLVLMILIPTFKLSGKLSDKPRNKF